MGCGASSPTERELEKEASSARLPVNRKEASISRPNAFSSNRLTTPTITATADKDGGEGIQPNPLVASSTAIRENSNTNPPAGKSGVFATNVTPRDASASALPTVAAVAAPPPSQSVAMQPAAPSSSNQPNGTAAQAAPAFPSYTITDSRGCRVVTMIQNRVKVETMCRWLDNVLRARDEAGGVFRNMDAHRENPSLRDDVGRETSSVSSRAGHSRVSEQSMTVFLNVSTTHDMQSRTMVGTTAAQGGGSQVDEQLASRAGPLEEE